MFGCGPYGWGTMAGWGAMGWPLFALWIGLKVAFAVLLVMGLVAGVRWLRRQTQTHTHSPLDALRMRYARGEVSKQDFDAMRRDLE